LPATPARCRALGQVYQPSPSPGARASCISSAVAAAAADENARTAVTTVVAVSRNVQSLTGQVHAIDRRFVNFANVSPVLVREAAACEAREYNPAHRINPAYDCATIAQRLQDAQRAATGQPPVATADEGEPAPDATTVAAGTAPAFLTP
jgi:hypothetical protein